MLNERQGLHCLKIYELNFLFAEVGAESGLVVCFQNEVLEKKKR